MTAADIAVLREIAPGAQVAPDAAVGPFCVVGPHVRIGAGTRLESRVTVIGHTTIGRDNVVGAGTVLGAPPQDLKYHGRPTYLIVGDRNRFAANVTAHVGTEVGGYLTVIGHDNVLMPGAHVAHDCYVDDRVCLGPGVLLAGHIRVMTGAVIEEMVGVTHFTTIGRYSRVGARTPVTRDVPPFAFFTSMGYYACPPAVTGPNEPGIRAALPPDQVEPVARAVRRLFQDDQALSVKVDQMLAEPDLSAPLRELAEFCRRSLDGTYGRFREAYRGKLPPEAAAYLPPELRAELARK